VDETGQTCVCPSVNAMEAVMSCRPAVTWPCGEIAEVPGLADAGHITVPIGVDRDGASRAVSRLSEQRTAQTSPAETESQRPRASWRQRPHTVYHHEHALLVGGGAFPCCTGPAEDRDLRFCPASLA
jgi:hypothetical protein